MHFHRQLHSKYKVTMSNNYNELLVMVIVTTLSLLLLSHVIASVQAQHVNGVPRENDRISRSNAAAVPATLDEADEESTEHKLTASISRSDSGSSSADERWWYGLSHAERICERTCVSTEQQLIDELDTIRTEQGGIGTVNLCTSTRTSPLELNQQIRLSGESYTNVTIGCCGTLSRSWQPAYSPKCSLGKGVNGEIIVGDRNRFAVNETLSDVSFAVKGIEFFQIAAGEEVALIIAGLKLANTFVISQCKFRDFQATDQFFIDIKNLGSISVTIDRSVFYNNVGYVYVYEQFGQEFGTDLPLSDSLTLTLSRSVFDGNSGGLTLGAYTAQLMIDRTTFMNAFSSNKNTLFVRIESAFDVSIMNSAFINNTVAGDNPLGAATIIINDLQNGIGSGTITIDNCRFEDNSITEVGTGAALTIYTYYDPSPIVSITRSIFKDNFVGYGFGGAINVSGVSRLKLDECTFYDNAVKNARNSSKAEYPQGGGALYAIGIPMAIILDSDFPNAFTSSASVTNCRFKNNDVDDGNGSFGAAALLNFNDVEVVSSAFVKNTASTSVGAVGIQANTIMIDDCYFKNNAAFGRDADEGAPIGFDQVPQSVPGAGALYIAGKDNAQIIDSKFIDNVAPVGGALYIDAFITSSLKTPELVSEAPVTIDDCVARGNEAVTGADSMIGGFGGFVFTSPNYGSSNNLSITDTRLKRNSASIEGDNIYVSGDEVGDDDEEEDKKRNGEPCTEASECQSEICFPDANILDPSGTEFQKLCKAPIDAECTEDKGKRVTNCI